MLAIPYSRYIMGSLPWYSVLIVAAICAALLIASHEEKRLKLPADTVIDAALWVIPTGIIGARLYYVIFAWDAFKHDPVSILKIWQGGLAIYGGIIGGFLGGTLFARHRKIPLSLLTDIVAPGLALAQAIGRWGNYFNMEAYGAEITNPAWQFFPAAVFIPSHFGGSWYMATFFYESMWNLLVFGLLMLSRKSQRRPGDTFLWYMSLYGAGRFVIEGLRSDSLMTGNIRVSQLLSLCLCLASLLIFLVRLVQQGKGKHAAVFLAAAIAAVVSALLIPVPLLVRTILLSMAVLIISAYTYHTIKPSASEDTLCQQRP